jgi:type I restriction enzyme S subunit
MEKISEIDGSISTELESIEVDAGKGYTRFQRNDLLWARITPCMQNGKSAVARNLINNGGLGSTEYFIFRAKHQNNIDYLHAILRLKYLRESAIFYFGGATGHQRVTPDFFRRLYIPLPSIEKQNEIAKNIQAIYNQAAALQREAAQILEDAKAAVERMILGEC